MTAPAVGASSQSVPVAEPGVFRGTTADECEEFIADVRMYAKTKDKTRDDDWIVDEVYGSFRGRALRWYLKQPLEVREDWESLQQAMMKEWYRDEVAPSPPAAAPTSPLSTRRARTTCPAYLLDCYPAKLCEKGEMVDVLDNSGANWRIRTDGGVVGSLQ